MACEIIEYNTLNGEHSVGIKKNEHIYRLTSLYNEKEQIEYWSEKYKNCNKYCIFVMYGLANGAYMEKLINLYDSAVFLIYEPSEEIYTLFENKYEKNRNVYITCGEHGKKILYNLFDIFIDSSSYRFVEWIVLPNYDKIWKEDILNIYRQYAYFINMVAMGEKTKAVYNNSIGKGYIKILPDILNQSSINDFKNEISKNVYEDSVAVVVAAGPSLEKNIDELKRIKNKAFIIAVDTALRPLYTHKIFPDIVVTIDNKKEESFFDTPDFKYIPLIIETTGNYKIVEKHRGKRIYASTGENYTSVLLGMVGKKCSALQTGGSVGNTAFFLAMAIGFKKIVLVGHDLAMSDGKIHASGIHDEEKENVFDGITGVREVEGYYGGKVKTREDYYAYLKWFELQIECHPELKVVNATEGGAKIRGTQNKSLDSIVTDLCDQLPNIDYMKIIENVPKVCSDSEKIEIMNYLGNLPSKLNEYKEKIQHGVDLYLQLNALKKKNNVGTIKFNSCLKEIRELNKWLETINEKHILLMYEAEDKSQLEHSIYEVQKDVEDEWTAIIKLGIDEYNLYLTRIDDLLKDLADSRIIP